MGLSVPRQASPIPSESKVVSTHDKSIADPLTESRSLHISVCTANVLLSQLASSLNYLFCSSALSPFRLCSYGCFQFYSCFSLNPMLYTPSSGTSNPCSHPPLMSVHSISHRPTTSCACSCPCATVDQAYIQLQYIYLSVTFLPTIHLLTKVFDCVLLFSNFCLYYLSANYYLTKDRNACSLSLDLTPSQPHLLGVKQWR